MPTVLLASELGGGYGHLAKLARLAPVFAARGWRVAVATGEPPLARAMLGEGPRIVAAPPAAPDTGVVPLNFSGVLLASGYGEARALAERVRLWLDLFDRTGPSLVVAEFAPTALLAARAGGVRAVSVGTGYTIPPDVTPWPALRCWEPVDPAALAALDAAVLGTIEAALARLGARTLGRLGALFEGPCCLATVPELDHYPGRGEADYYGPLDLGARGARVEFPPGEGPALFAYVRGARADFPAIVRALAGSGARVLLHARGVTGVRGSARLRCSAEPVDLPHALARADAVVCQGSGTIAAALLAGKPVVLLPEHAEQAMIAHVVQARGLGRALLPGADETAMAAAIVSVLTDGTKKEAAANFQRHYQGFDPAVAALEVAATAIDRS